MVEREEFEEMVDSFAEKIEAESLLILAYDGDKTVAEHVDGRVEEIAYMLYDFLRQEETIRQALLDKVLSEEKGEWHS